MARKKLFGNRQDAACRLCEFGQSSANGETILCPSKGVVSPEYACRRFRYDPLKRVPARQKPLQSFSLSAFSLEDFALDEYITPPANKEETDVKQGEAEVFLLLDEKSAMDTADDAPLSDATQLLTASSPVQEIRDEPTTPTAEESAASTDAEGGETPTAEADEVAASERVEAFPLSLSDEEVSLLTAYLSLQDSPVAQHLLQRLQPSAAADDTEQASPAPPHSDNIASIRASLDESTLLLLDEEDDEPHEEETALKDLLLLSEETEDDFDDDEMLLMTEDGPALRFMPPSV